MYSAHDKGMCITRGVGMPEPIYSKSLLTVCLAFLQVWGTCAVSDVGCLKLRWCTLEVLADVSHMCQLMLHSGRTNAG